MFELVRTYQRDPSRAAPDAVVDLLNRRDMELLGPLSYAQMIASESLPASFDLDADYINDMFLAPQSIVAVTSRNPTGWMSPLFYFYLVNNGVASLVGRAPTSLAMKNRSDPEYTQFSCDERRTILEGMRSGTMPGRGASVRFFVLPASDYECYREFVAAIRALHELFGCHCILLDADELKGDLQAWEACHALARRLGQTDGEQLPDFLLLPGAHRQLWYVLRNASKTSDEPEEITGASRVVQELARFSLEQSRYVKGYGTEQNNHDVLLVTS